jgi:hypothetical protein
MFKMFFYSLQHHDEAWEQGADVVQTEAEGVERGVTSTLRLNRHSIQRALMEE